MATVPPSLSAELPSGVTITIARKGDESLEAMQRRLADEVKRACASDPATVRTFLDKG